MAAHTARSSVDEQRMVVGFALRAATIAASTPPGGSSAQRTYFAAARARTHCSKARDVTTVRATKAHCETYVCARALHVQLPMELPLSSGCSRSAASAGPVRPSVSAPGVPSPEALHAATTPNAPTM